MHRLGATLLKRLDELGAMPGLLPAGASAATLEQARQAVRARSVALSQLAVDPLHPKAAAAATAADDDAVP